MLFHNDGESPMCDILVLAWVICHLIEGNLRSSFLNSLLLPENLLSVFCCPPKIVISSEISQELTPPHSKVASDNL